MGDLYDKLKKYSNSDYYGFHMPGHKRNIQRFGTGIPYGIDITEIEGFDDLHHAASVIKEAEERAARLYKAEETHFLINGSTVGILSAILGTTERGDKTLVSRNCHKSVYHAIFLNELNPVYVYPEYEKELQINGEVTVESICRALEANRGVKAVMLVSPTYEGVLLDIKSIAEAVHRYGIPLIVDEAHGAHFGFSTYFPENANTKGADIVIHSVHKTLPAMTQTALIHMNGDIVDRDRVRSFLHILQSSSPSYVLMASIDYCMDILERREPDLFREYAWNIESLRRELDELKHLKIIKTGEFDNSKFIISVKDANITSKELYRILLEKYHLQMEMASGSYVLAMTSVGDTEEGLKRLREALFEIDAELETVAAVDGKESMPEIPRLPIVLNSSEVLKNVRRDGISYLKWSMAVGKVAAEYAYIYPPGIPFVVPGERITAEASAYLERYDSLGFTIEGIREKGHIGVWENG